MKKALICITLAYSTLLAVPEGADVAAGQAEFQFSDAKTLKITTSDKAIINYQKFNIGKEEHVEFSQPSSKSIVLNRVKGGDSSQILGKLSGNGRVFLVNPSGIYFGPDAVVNTGSFLASTLNIRDDDFLNENYKFFLEPGSEKSTIVNRGSITASPEGFVAFFAPFIENRGSIFARAGKIVLAAAERVTLDFSGDGLIQFTVDGELKKALIKNYGLIEAAGGAVEIELKSAKAAIKMVVNADGITPADDIEESNGVIRLVSTSVIRAGQVKIEGEKVEVAGLVDVIEGRAHIFGDNIQLTGAKIDASGIKGGGEVLIGGDYQGQGGFRTAQNVIMDSASQILSDAYKRGNGGKVILWSDDTTLFNGTIFARGGKWGGDGGFVETSGKESLGVETGYVNTSAPFGNFGNWLLDPNNVTIAAAGGGTIAQASAPNCGTGGNVTISVATMQAAATNVALCSQQNAGSSITVNSAFTMAAGVSLSMTAGSTNVGNINLNANITTRGQPITLTGVAVIGANVTLDTTNAGGSPAGSNISFSNTINGSGARTLTLTGGTGGVVTMSGAVGAGTALTTLTATGATINQSSTAKTTGALSYTGTTAINIGGNTTTSGGVITMTGPVAVSTGVTFDSTNAGGTAAGANISFTSTLNGAQAVAIRAGTGGIATFTGAVGGANPLTNLSFTSANLIRIGNNITVTGANPLVFSSPVSLTGTSNITSNNANITFSNTLNGAQALTLTGGAGTTTFTGAVGGTTPLSSLSATAATVTQSSTAKTTGALSYTGSTAINIGGNITTSGGIVTMTGPVTISTTPTIDTTNAGGTAAGANISFSSTLNGATALTLRAGTGGNVTFTGAVGNSAPLTNLTFTSANLIQIGNNITVTGVNPLVFSSPVSLIGTSNITSNNANITFSSTLNGAQALTLTGGAGTVTFTGAVGNTTPLTNLTFASAALIQIGNNITVSGANPLTFPTPVSLTGTSNITSNNANITFSNTLNGAQALTLTGGTGITTFTGAVGGTTPLASLAATAATITQSSTVKTTGILTYNGSTAINLNGNVTTSSGIIGMTGPVNLTNSVTLDTTNAGGSPTGANITITGTVNGAHPLSLLGGTSGVVLITGGIGGITPVTSLTISGLTVTQSSSLVATGAVSYTGTAGISVGGNITTSGGTITMTGPVTVSGNPTFDTTNGGTVAGGANISFSNTVNGATALTLRSGTVGFVSLGGAVGGVTPLTNLSFTSASSIRIGDNITVSGANPLSFPSVVVLTGNSTITSTNNSISFASTINGDGVLPRTLQLAAGSGSITLTGAVGGTTPLNNLTLTSANNVTANGITVVSLSQSAGSGTSTFNGAVSTSGGLGVNLTGNNFTFNNTVTTTGGGGASITNAGILSMPNGSTFTIAGAFSQTGTGSVQAGNTMTANGISIADAVALTHAASFSTAATPQPILFSSTIDSLSTTPFNLTLDAGTSNITVLGNIGSIHPVGAFLINQANNVTTQGVTATSVTINGGTGTTTVNGDVVVGPGDINLTGNNFVNNGNLVTTGGGSVTINNSGTATRSPGHTTVVSGNYSLIGTGPAFAGSGLTVQGNILINPAVTLVADAVIDTSVGGGSITFSSTINGAHNLTINAGSGTILMSGNVGSSVPVGALTIGSATNWTTQGIQATSITQTSGTGTTTFNGALITSGSSGISINTNAITRGAAITTTGSGPLTITNSGLFTSTAPGAISLAGAFLQNGAGAVTFAGTMTTTNSNITFSSPITLAGITSLSTGSGLGNINLNQTVQGAFPLTLNSGTGNITLGGNIGTVITPLTGLTITSAANVSTQGIVSSFISQLSGTGTTTFSGALSTTVAGISLTGSAFTFNNTFTTATTVSITNSGLLTFSAGATGVVGGALTQSGGGSTVLSSTITAAGAMQWNDPFAASGTGSLTTQAANQPITFFSTVNGPGNLTLSSGTADILISGNAGSLTPLGNLTIATVKNLTTQAVAASSITQSAGTGTTLFNGDLSTTGGSGINLTGSLFTFVGNATATGSGSILIANGGVLTTTASKTLSAGGGFSQTGAGAVSLASNVTTNSLDISFVSPITLTADVILNGARDITVGTADGFFDLTLTAGRDIFAGALGGVSRLDNMIITTVRNATLSDITAATIVQSAGTGTTFLNGNLNTNTLAGISLTGTNFSRTGSITTTNSGNCTIANSGALTINAISTTSIDGSYTQTAIGPSSTAQLAGTLTANGGISLSSPMTLISEPIILDSSGGNGDITATATITGPHTLILRSGTGHVVLNSAVGPIGPLKLGNIQNFTAAAISADSITQELATTIAQAATFNGAITTSGASGISLTGNIFNFNNNVTTTGGGAVSIVNSGLLTLANGTLFSLDGLFSQTGAGSVSFGGSIITTNDAISFASPVLLTAAASLNSGAGAGDITLSGTLNGAHTLDLTAGTGNIALQGAIGQSTPLTGMTIHSGNTVLVSNNTTLSGPLVTSVTGSTTFGGALSASAIDLTGAAITFNNSVASTVGSIAIANGGILTIPSTSPITSNTSFMQTGVGTVSLGANISTSGILSLVSPITLTNHVLLNSGGGNITVSNTVAGLFNFTLTAGAGDITLSGNIGAPRIGAMTITSANNITVQAITAASISLLSATGTSTLNGSFDTDTNIGITLVGNNFISSGTITTTNGGPLTVTNSGLVTATGASTITLNGGGAFTQNGTGPVNLGGTITTQNASISHSSPVFVLLPTIFTSNNGTITFSNTINGPACLTLNGGTGDIHLNGVVGGTTPLGCLTASGTNIFQTSNLTTTGAVQEAATTMNIGGNITTAGSDITLTGNVTLTASSTISTSNLAGNISITGTVNGNVAGRDLTIQTGTGDITLSSPVANNTHFNSLTLTGQNISWNNLGSGVIGVSGTTTVTAANNVNFTGTTYNNGTQIYTAVSNFNFTAVGLTTVTTNANPITFNTGTIQLGATTNLTIDSNAGHITLTPLLGTGRNLTVNADTGALNFVQIGASGFDLGNVNLTSNSITPNPVLNGNVFAGSLIVNNSVVPLIISTNQTIPQIPYDVPVIIQGNISYTCGAGGTITFNKRVDANTPGVDTLTFNFSPCGGSVIFNDPVGAVAPLAALSTNAAQDVTFNGTVNVGALTVTNGVGITSLNSGITSTASGGVHITTPTINLAGSLTTASGGPLVLNNSGLLTVAAGTSFDIAGAFQQTGAGNVTIGGSIVVHDNPIQFTGAVTLNSPFSCNSKDLTGGTISFASTIQGAQSLTLTSGSGDITLNGALGTLVTPLTTLQIIEAHNVTASASIFAQSITQSAGSGLSSFSALTSAGGINLTGSAFTLNGNITSGSAVITNSGTVTFANAIYSIGGVLTQNGAGAVTLAGTFTAGGAVSFAQGVTLSSAVSIDTSANAEPIFFGSSLTNDLGVPHDLTLNAGSSNITLTGNVGAAPIGVFTITNAGNVAASGISAASITQTAASGTTTIMGSLATTNGTGIHLTGTNFNLNSTVTTAGTGPFSIVNTGPLSLTLGSSTLIDGAFTQSGGGLVSFAGTLATNNQNLSFANAISLVGASSLSTGSGAGAITLSSTVNGNSSLDLTAGTGNIIFGANLGASTPLGALTIHSVQNITYPLVNAASITQSPAGGTTTITGPFTTTASGVSIAGVAINQNGLITALNTGSVNFINSGLLTIIANTTAPGGYSQSGGGSVSLGGSITAANGNVSFVNPVNLTADIALISGPTNGTGISFDSPITGAQALALTASFTSIVFSGDVGTIGTPLTSLTIFDADTVLTQGIFAGSITQLVGTTSTTFQGAINASTASGISLAGTAFTFDDTITSAGSLILTNSGLATINGNGAITGALTQNGSGATQLSSAITTGSDVIFSGPFSTVGTGSLSTANQPITFLNTVDGPGNLTLATGTDDIEFQLNVGDSQRLGALQITTARNVTAQSVKAASILQSAGSNLTLFQGDLNTNGASGIHLIGVNQTFSGNATTTGSGPITLTNSGTLTTTIGKTFSSNGTFTQNGSGSVLLGSTVTTTNPTPASAGINFSGTSPITLIGPTIINSSIGGGTINFSASSTVNGAQPITLTAGTGDINILGNFGSIVRLGALTITSAHDIQAQVLRASSLAQLAGSGTSNLLGSFDTNTPAGITLIGNNFIVGPLATSITTTNGGSLTLTNQGVVTGSLALVVTLDGAFIQNGPGIVFTGPITARLGISFTGPVIVPAATTLDSSGGAGGITFTNRISGFGGAGALILTAGAGDITTSQPIGLTTNIGPYPVNALTSLTASGHIIAVGDIGDALNPGVTGTTTLTAASDIDFSGTTYNANTQNYTVSTFFHMVSGAPTTLSSNGATMTFSGGGFVLDTGTDLTMNTGGSNLTLGTIHAQAGNLRHLTLNTGAGSLQVGNIGTLGNGEFATASFTASTLNLQDAFAGAFTFSYTTLNAAGDIVSTDSPLTFPSTVVLQGTNIFSTLNTTGADITFSGILNAAAADTFGLTLRAGSGNIAFSNTVGVPNRLLNLTLASANNVTFAPALPVVLDSLVQQSGSGTTTFNGPLTVVSPIGILLTGNNFTFPTTVNTLNNGSLSVTNSGTLNFAGTATLSGAFTQTTTAPTTLSGSITAGQPISFAGPVTLSGSPTLNTAAASQTIQFQNTIGGSGNLTLTAGSGNIFLQQNAGTSVSPIGAVTVNSSHNITAQSVFATSINVISSTGLATINNTLSTTGAAGIHLIGNNFLLNGALFTTGGGSVIVTNSGLISGTNATTRTVDGSYTQNGTGPVQFAGSLLTKTGPISFTSPLTLVGPSSFDSSMANQNITFSSTIDGPSSLTITAGGGDITFVGAVGAIDPISNFTVNSSHDIHLNGIGTTATGVSGTLSLTASHDIDLLNTFYSAGTQFYSAANNTNLNTGSTMELTSFGGPIQFTSGTAHLANGSNLTVLTNNGNFSFINLTATSLENLIVNTTAGTAALGSVSPVGGIDALAVLAGKVTFSGPIDPTTVNIVSLTDIMNIGPPVLIQTTGDAFFNALGGNVGSLSSPILVQSGGLIFAGAFGSASLADFNGSSSDNTVHPIPSNPPCIIIFNGVTIKDCRTPPTPPPTPPSPPRPNIARKIPPFPFAVPGFDSSYFNLASDYFFLPYFFNNDYLRVEVAICWRAKAKKRWSLAESEKTQHNDSSDGFESRL